MQQCDGKHRQAAPNKDALCCTLSDEACDWQQCPESPKDSFFVTVRMVPLAAVSYSASLKSMYQIHQVGATRENL
jgi:hypothetical protein